MKLKKICVCMFAFLLTVLCSSLVMADVNIQYSYTSITSSGSVRYISQIKSSKYFNSAYWGKWDGSSSIKCANGSWYGGPIQECLTCCMSMSLSYIGVDKTPEDILNFGSGITIVNTKWGGAVYKSSAFTQAMDNYLNGNGKYSPPIIHLNSYSSAGHYVVVIGKLSGNRYRVADPARDSIWEITINGNTATYTTASGVSKKDTVTTAQQYYKESSEIIKPFLSNVDVPNTTDVYTSDVVIGGWAIYGKGITKVCGTINGKNISLNQISRPDVAKVYYGYPTGKEGFSGVIPAAMLKNGSNQLELNAYYNDTVFHIASMNVDFKNEVMPEISDVQIEKDVEGYTITCHVSDDFGIDRVQFPTWTEENGQDDIDRNWSNSEQSRGLLENGKVSFRVNRAEHNNETGKYYTHIYAYDIHGNYSVKGVEVDFAVVAPELLATEEFNGATYEFYDLGEMTLDDAELFCEFKGGKICLGEGEEEITFLMQVVESMDKVCFVCRYTYKVLKGDVDLDGVVSALDALVILKHAANIELLQEEKLIEAADCDNDGAATANDALIVLKMAAGLE